MLDFAGHSLKSFRPESHKTLVALLRQRRKDRQMTLKEVAAKVPTWMKFDFSKLARIERSVRNVSYAELREIAKALGTDVSTLSAQVEEIIRAKSGAGRKKR